MRKRTVALLIVGVAVGAACVAGTVAACMAVKKAKAKKLALDEDDIDLLEEA